jgi:hypothetical protein
MREKLLLLRKNAGTGELKKLLSGETRNKLKKNCELIEKFKTNTEDSNHSRIFKLAIKVGFV